MKRIPDRPWLLIVLIAFLGVLAAGVAGCGGDEAEPTAGEQPAAEAEAKRVAIINFAPVSFGDWDPANFRAFQAMVEKFGFTPSNEEGVNYDEAPAVLRRLAQDNDVVIASSAGYGDAVLRVAQEMPETFFIVFSDLASTKGLPNVAAWKINWNQVGYLAAAIACFAADGRRVGHLNSEPIPAFTRFAGGAEQAAEEHCANGLADYRTTWIRSFTDISKGKQASLAMIQQGAEVLFASANGGGLGALEAAKERNKKFIHQYLDQCDQAPDHCITSWTIDFNGSYEEMGKLFSEGTLEPQLYDITIENGGIGVVTPFRNVDPSVEERTLQLIEDIKAGKVKVDPTRESRP